MANTTGSVDAAGSLGAIEARAAAAGQCKKAMPVHSATVFLGDTEGYKQTQIDSIGGQTVLCLP